MFGLIDIKNATDEQLMAWACKGKQKAFEELYDRYYRKLVCFTYKQISDLQLAEDIVQDVFIRIIEKPEKFDTKRKFSTWVYTVTSNAYKNAVRNDMNRIRLLQTSFVKYNDTVMDNSKNDAQILRKMIDGMLRDASDKERLIYTLRFEMDLSITEIATIADIPEGSVKSCIFYLLKKLKPNLKDLKNDG